MSEPLKVGDKCPRNCGGTLFHDTEEGVLRCHSCQRPAGPPPPPPIDKKTPKKKRPYHRSKDIPYYMENLAQIRADYDKMALPELLEHWGMSKNLWTQIRPKVMEQPVPQETSTVSTENSSTVLPAPELETSSGAPIRLSQPESLSAEQIREMVKNLNPAQKEKFYIEDHKEEILKDAETMSNSQIKTKWAMSDKRWLRLRHLWCLPIGTYSNVNPTHHKISGVVNLVDKGLEKYKTIEEFKAWWEGIKLGRGWRFETEGDSGS